MNTKKFATIVLIIIAIMIVINTATAEVLMPQLGNKTKKSGMLTIDYSNCTEGYVMVKAKPTKKALKLRVVHNEMDIHYDLNSKGEYEVFPLQDGNGKYTFTLYAKAKGNQYQKLNTISITVDMPDPNRCFLYPNQYINYTPDTPAIIRAQEICEGITDPIEKARAIYRAIFLDDTIEYEITNSEGETEIVYGEEIKFTYRQLDPSPLPNINKAFATNAGVCKDQAGLYTAMLRSVGVPAIYAVGDGEPSHAWTVLIINGKRYQMDLILHLHFDLIPDDMTYTRTY